MWNRNEMNIKDMFISNCRGSPGPCQEGQRRNGLLTHSLASLSDFMGEFYDPEKSVWGEMIFNFSL